MMLALASTLTLASCATTTTLSVGTKVDQRGPSSLLFCDGAKPIYWAADDTDKTIRQVKEHNAVGKTFCHWGTRKP
jgi:hypothetical protein